MTEENTAFVEERMRLAVERAESDAKIPRKKRRKQLLSVDRLEDDRDIDRILMAKTCALRWGTPPRDNDGNPVDFSEENVLAFLRALPNRFLDPCRGWASNAFNFVDSEAVKPAWANAEELGNS